MQLDLVEQQLDPAEQQLDPVEQQLDPLEQQLDSFVQQSDLFEQQQLAVITDARDTKKSARNSSLWRKKKIHFNGYETVRWELLSFCC